MKYISEERLREIVVNSDDLSEAELFYINLLINECQELDTLEVSKLRPMCEAPRDESPFLASPSYNNSEYLKETYFNGEYFSYEGYELDQSDFKGWIPMPTYKPEQP